MQRIIKFILRFKIPLLVVAFAATILHSLILVPHYYPLCQYFISYRFGFIKRAFIGTLLTPFVAGRNNGELIWIVSIFSGIFLALFFMTLIVKWITATKNNHLVFLSGFVFFVSPFIAFLSNNFGYFDSIIYLITLICSLCILNNVNIVLIIALNITGILIQEIYLVVSLPVIIFTYALRDMVLQNEKAGWSWKLQIFIRNILCILFPVSILLLILYKNSFSEDIYSYMQSLHIMTEEWINYGLWTLRVPLYEDWRRGFQFLKVSHLLEILPTTFFYLILSLTLYFKYLSGRDKINNCLMIAIIMFCSFSPCLLILFAWDVGRILSFTNFNAFIIYFLMIKTNRKDDLLNFAGKRVVTLIILLSVFNLSLLAFNYLPLEFVKQAIPRKDGFAVIDIFDVIF